MEKTEPSLSSDNKTAVRVENDKDPVAQFMFKKKDVLGRRIKMCCDLNTNPKKKVLLTMSVTRYLDVIRMLLKKYWFWIQGFKD